MATPNLDHVYTYHPPFGTQVERYVTIRNAARAFAEVVKANCPPSREQSLAQTSIQSACQMANAAIAINELAPAEPVATNQESV